MRLVLAVTGALDDAGAGVAAGVLAAGVLAAGVLAAGVLAGRATLVSATFAPCFGSGSSASVLKPEILGGR